MAKQITLTKKQATEALLFWFQQNRPDLKVKEIKQIRKMLDGTERLLVDYVEDA